MTVTCLSCKRKTLKRSAKRFTNAYSTRWVCPWCARFMLEKEEFAPKVARKGVAIPNPQGFAKKVSDVFLVQGE